MNPDPTSARRPDSLWIVPPPAGTHARHGAMAQGDELRWAEVSDGGQPCTVKSIICSAEGQSPLLAEMENEYEISRQFTHPGLRRSLRFRRQRLLMGDMVQAVLATERVDGAPLTDHAPADGQDSVHSLLQVAQALAALHAMGYVHGDLRPENIVIAEDGGQAKLINFGRTRRIAPAEGTSEDVRAFGEILLWAITGRGATCNLQPRELPAAEADTATGSAPGADPSELDPRIQADLRRLACECLGHGSQPGSLQMEEIVRRLQAVVAGLTA